MLTISYSASGGSEIAPPSQDDVQQMCDQFPDIVTALAPGLSQLPTHETAVTPHDPCVPLAALAGTIHAATVTRTLPLECTAQRDGVTVQFTYGAPLAGVPGQPRRAAGRLPQPSYEIWPVSRTGRR